MTLVDRKQTGRRVGTEWYDCDNCGFQYPRASVVVQNGLTLCTGTDTTNCVDLPGHTANLARMTRPVEKENPPLPVINEDL